MLSMWGLLMREISGMVALVIGALLFVGVAFYLIKSACEERGDRCRAVGGHIFNPGRATLCIKDGKIIEDY